VGAISWELSKIGFGWWAVQVATYNRVYGPLAASVIVMLWLWLSGIIFLFGAQLSAVMQGSRAVGVERQSWSMML
jgi:membrane protein